MDSPKVYIVVPVFNRLNDTKAFIDSIRNQDYRSIQIVICDDASTDGTAEFITNSAPEVVMVQGTGNLWWAGGINRCIEYVLRNASDADLVLTMNNDTVVEPDYVSQKVKRSFEFPHAVIGSTCVYQSSHDLIETSGFIMNFGSCTSRSLVKHGARRSEIPFAGCRDVTHLPGKGVLIPVVIYRKIGLYAEKELPHYHADTDFTLRAYENGFRVLIDFDSTVYSDVNVGNMNMASTISLRGIVNTFRWPKGVNNFRSYLNFARNHFPDRKARYLITTYVIIIGGLLRRYVISKLSVLRRLKSS